MDKKEIIKLVEEAIRHNSETPKVEFKDGRGGLPRKIWETVSSFSHSPGGGIIVFGVMEGKDKKLEVIGTDNIAELQEKFSNLVSNEMSTVIRPDYHIVEIMTKNVLAVYVPECPEQFKPCYYKPAGMPNGACIRDGNTDRKMTDEEMRRLIENSKKLKFDTLQAEGTSLADLSKEKIFNLLIQSGKRTQRDIASNEISFELLKNLGIADEFDGIQAPTVGGFLVFARGRPQDKQNFSRYIVRCVKFKGD